MPRKKEYIGLRQGKLTVVSLVSPGNKNRPAIWLCHCDCGSDFWASSNSINAGQRSCGCLKSEAAVRRTIDQQERQFTGGLSQKITSHYLRIKESCPAWYATTLPHVVEGVCNMIARNQHTEAFIAHWWECPESFIRVINSACNRRIASIKAELGILIPKYERALGPKIIADDYHASDSYNSLRNALSAKSMAGHWKG